MSGPIGPPLPPGFQVTRSREEDTDEDDPSVPVGPLPADVPKNADSATTIGPPPQSRIGPSLPPPSNTTSSAAAVDCHAYGPTLPPQFRTSDENDTTTPSPAHSESEGSDEDGMIGPMPSTKVCLRDHIDNPARVPASELPLMCSPEMRPPL